MYPCMKRRHLENIVQQIDAFVKPKIFLEQYVTPPFLAATMLHTIQTNYGDIDGKYVADLGSGCGALTIGAASLDAGHVVGFEIDQDAIDIFLKNVNEQEISNIDAVQCDVRYLSSRWDKTFDTVILNPPFGTKHNVGIDVVFLKTALRMSNNSVYSLHKSSTRDYILKTGKSLGVDVEVLAELTYDLSKTYKFHKKHSVDIAVDLFRFKLIN